MSGLDHSSLDAAMREGLMSAAYLTRHQPTLLAQVEDSISNRVEERDTAVRIAARARAKARLKSTQGRPRNAAGRSPRSQHGGQVSRTESSASRTLHTLHEAKTRNEPSLNAVRGWAYVKFPAFSRLRAALMCFAIVPGSCTNASDSGKRATANA
jgi:hypothetical protein